MNGNVLMRKKGHMECLIHVNEIGIKPKLCVNMNGHFNEKKSLISCILDRKYIYIYLYKNSYLRGCDCNSDKFPRGKNVCDEA